MSHRNFVCYTELCLCYIEIVFIHVRIKLLVIFLGPPISILEQRQFIPYVATCSAASLYYWYVSLIRDSMTNAQTQQLWWSRGSVLPLSIQVRGFKPSRSRQDFSGRKNHQHAFLRKGVKPWVPCRRYAACKISMNWRGISNFRQNYRLILAQIVPPFATRISHVVVDVEVPHGERGNIQTVGGDRVGTISLQAAVHLWH